MNGAPLIPPPGASPDAFREWRAAALERRAAGAQQTDRLRRAIWRRGLLHIMLVEWAAVLLMLWSFHTADPVAGKVAFWSSLALGDGGFLLLFTATWRRAARVTPE
jgi:polyferredoxin